MSVPFDPPADCEIAELPDPRVKTRNGVPVEADMEFFYCYSPKQAAAYRVLSDTAYRLPTGRWQVWVIDSKGWTSARSPQDHSTDMSEWIDFFRKRHKGQTPEGNGSTPTKRSRRSRVKS